MSVAAELHRSILRVKAVAGRTADFALDRIEGFVARPSRSSPQPIRLTCVFLQWDPQRAPAELDALAERLRSWPELEFVIILVDNRTPQEPTARNDNATFIIGGDNTAWEFSGLQAGIDAARTKGIKTDVWLLVNDRYRADTRPFLRYLTGATVRGAIELRAIVGHIDAYPRTVSSYGYSIRRWVTTSFLLASDEVLQSCLPLVAVTADEIESVISDSEVMRFRPRGPIGADHAAYLTAWLTDSGASDLRTRWYGAGPPGSLDVTVLRRKVQSILNEQLLSARALALGIPLIAIQDAHRLATLGLSDSLLQRERQRLAQSDVGGDATTGRIRRLGFALRILLNYGKRRRDAV